MATRLLRSLRTTIRPILAKPSAIFPRRLAFVAPAIISAGLILAPRAAALMSPRMAHAQAGPVLSSSQEIRTALESGVLVDLRTPKEIEEQPGPPEAVVWDYNASPEVPLGLLPKDKSTPIILY